MKYFPLFIEKEKKLFGERLNKNVKMTEYRLESIVNGLFEIFHIF